MSYEDLRGIGCTPTRGDVDLAGNKQLPHSKTEHLGEASVGDVRALRSEPISDVVGIVDEFWRLSHRAWSLRSLILPSRGKYEIITSQHYGSAEIGWQKGRIWEMNRHNWSIGNREDAARPARYHTKCQSMYLKVSTSIIVWQ